MTPWVYRFGNGSADGAASLRDLLGGKGANLAEMSNLGLPLLLRQHQNLPGQPQGRCGGWACRVRGRIGLPFR
jgi:hypothetical protein